MNKASFLDAMTKNLARVNDDELNSLVLDSFRFCDDELLFRTSFKFFHGVKCQQGISDKFIKNNREPNSKIRETLLKSLEGSRKNIFWDLNNDEFFDVNDLSLPDGENSKNFYSDAFKSVLLKTKNNVLAKLFRTFHMIYLGENVPKDNLYMFYNIFHSIKVEDLRLIDLVSKTVQKVLNQKKLKSKKKKKIPKQRKLEPGEKIILIYIESENQWYFRLSSEKQDKQALFLSPTVKSQLYSLLSLTEHDQKGTYKNFTREYKDRDDNKKQEEGRDTKLRKQLKEKIPYRFTDKIFSWKGKEKRYYLLSIVFKKYQNDETYNRQTTDFHSSREDQRIKGSGLSDHDD